MARNSNTQKNGFQALEQPAKTAEPETKPLYSKKERIITLYLSGMKDLIDIGRMTQAKPSYVARVLQDEGLISGYFDLYTPSAREQNVYSKRFQNVLAFKTVEAARESVQKIDTLYREFENQQDRAGQHQAMVLALVGMNRARWSGKLEEARIFHEWLLSRL